jgi:hypothetical protein
MIPCRLKLGVRAVLRAVGDFRVLTPFEAPSCGDGISIPKALLSLVGSGKGRVALDCEIVGNKLGPVVEDGESPVDDGDILCRS